MDSSCESSRSYRAGAAGPNVRSDCRVTLELRAHGGLQLELRSKVAGYYGASIREQVTAELRQLGVEDAVVLIEDAGALPFAISARLEAAARRAGIEARRGQAVVNSAARAQSPRDRLRRSRLYIPGSQPHYFVNAALYQPDAIILDLEDAVHPSEKDAARILVRNALAQIDFAAPGYESASCERMVRINPFPLGMQDLDEIVAVSPDVILIPKAETADQIRAVEAHIAEIQQDRGRSIWLMPILESALGIENAFAIASASANICSLAIGLEDYTADLGVVKTEAGTESLYARARIVNAARAAGVQASDSAYGNFGNPEGLRDWAQASRALGFDGMGCVHPMQVAPIHAAFAPSAQEIDRARQIVEAFEAAARSGSGVVALGSKMVDQPVVNRALKLLETALKMGLIAEPVAAATPGSSQRAVKPEEDGGG